MTPTQALLLLAAVLGLVVGSFLNVVVARVPAGESVVRPGSRCPRCSTPIRPWQNVPVLSWIALGARCASCSEPISWRYPALEAATSAAFVGVAAWAGASPALLAWWWVAAAALALVVIDVEHMRLPDAIVAPAGIGVAVLLGVAVMAGDERWVTLARAGVGGLVLAAAYGALWWVWPGGMGLGDVKLAPVVGLVLAWFGWPELAVGGFAAFVLALVATGPLLVAGRRGRKVRVPFGPWMVAGALVGVAWGDPVAGWWLGLVA